MTIFTILILPVFITTNKYICSHFVFLKFFTKSTLYSWKRKTQGSPLQKKYSKHKRNYVHYTRILGHILFRFYPNEIESGNLIGSNEESRYDR